MYWYDFLCPFCYVAQQRNAILLLQGLRLVELPFQAHPEIPAGGIPAGSREGPMYAMLKAEAGKAGLPLRWPRRLPNTRRALAVAEWTRRLHPRVFPQLRSDLFAAHFARGEDLEDLAVLDHYASRWGIDLPELHAGLTDGSAAVAVLEAEAIGRKHGVQGTPTWLLGQRLIAGLRPASAFDRRGEGSLQVSH